MKLDRAGIPVDGLALASSDDGVDRLQIMLTCLDRLGGHADQATYIGDGIWDLEASRQAGWAFIGVGEKLRGRCETWIADFTDDAWPLSHNNRMQRTRHG
jgi:phosphoglycolate phosphatase-like HAD superfamily hydrolase